MSQKILDEQTAVVDEATILCWRLIHFLVGRHEIGRHWVLGIIQKKLNRAQTPGPGRGTYCYIMQIKEKVQWFPEEPHRTFIALMRTLFFDPSSRSKLPTWAKSCSSLSGDATRKRKKKKNVWCLRFLTKFPSESDTIHLMLICIIL